MDIQNIARAEFQRLVPSRDILDGFIGTEIEWFANGKGTVIGVIALGRGGRDWNWVAFERQADGGYRAWKHTWAVDDREGAKGQLLRAMEACGRRSR